MGAKVLPKAAEKYKFKKGQPSLNPDGGRKHNPQIRKIKSLTKEELVEVATVLLGTKANDINKLMNDPKTTMLQAMVLGLVKRTKTYGNAAAFDALMNRILGKVKEEIDITGNMNHKVNVVITLPNNGRANPDVGKKLGSGTS